MGSGRFLWCFAMWTKAEIRAGIALALIAGIFGGVIGYIAGANLIVGAAAGFLFLIAAMALGTLIELVATRHPES